jgi:hypothetical protein
MALPALGYALVEMVLYTVAVYRSPALSNMTVDCDGFEVYSPEVGGPSLTNNYAFIAICWVLYVAIYVRIRQNAHSVGMSAWLIERDCKKSSNLEC